MFGSCHAHFFIYEIPAIVEIAGIFAFLFLVLLAHSCMLWRLLLHHVRRFCNRFCKVIVGNLQVMPLCDALPMSEPGEFSQDG